MSWHCHVTVGTEIGRSESGALSRPRATAETGSLTRHELELLAMVGQGKTLDRIARQAGVSPRTVRRRLRAACDTLGVSTPVEAAVQVARRGLI